MIAPRDAISGATKKKVPGRLARLLLLGFGDAPLLAKLLEGKLNDPKVKKAFEYWTAIAQTDKWLALPPKTPKNIVDVYRTAYAKIGEDPEFLERIRKISEDFVPLDAAAVGKLVTTLASLPPETTGYMTNILKKRVDMRNAVSYPTLRVRPGPKARSFPARRRTAS